ncbi:MAG: hypothetical protein QNJ38_12315 [Prochloraceae cyanobacterium]|nr:hypothetical protein [Prochloraceae cyanobacterium]
MARNFKIFYRSKFWLFASLFFTIFYSILMLKMAFASDYIVQDDARQHVFWMMRFLDADLFPNDLIADYFQSRAPIGYTLLYKIPAFFGVNPFLLNKLIPPFLMVSSAIYFYYLFLEIFPIPASAFLATLLFDQAVLVKDDLSSATPRAFLDPFFIAFLYYLLKENLILCLISLFLIGIFYPQYLFICGAILLVRLFKIENNRFLISKNQKDYRFFYSGCGIIIFAILIYLITTASGSQFNPVATLEQAKELPVFGDRGRLKFFVDNPFVYWIFAENSGLFPIHVFRSILIAFGIFLPIVLKYKSSFNLAGLITKKSSILREILFASWLMYLAAHLFLFKLHFPGRYNDHTLKIVLAIAAGIVISLTIEKLWQWSLQQRSRFQKILAKATISIAVICIVFYYPLLVNRFPLPVYVRGDRPQIYQFFAKQPQDITIASLAEEASLIPSFSYRSILVAREYGIPFHLGYYNRFRQRTIDLIEAQYTDNLKTVETFIDRYKINFWMLESASFTPEYLSNNKWLQQYNPTARAAEKKLEIGIEPILLQKKKDCQILEDKGVYVLDAKCIINQKTN